MSSTTCLQTLLAEARVGFLLGDEIQRVCHRDIKLLQEVTCQSSHIQRFIYDT